MKLSPDKAEVLREIISWLKAKNKKRNFITLGGYAGTGKTTLIAALRKILKKHSKNKKIAIVSYTGKAARVLETTLKSHQTYFEEDFVGTIHSLIYAPIVNNKGEITGWDKKSSIDAELIIIDEASMVNHSIWRDLASFKLPIIAIGDHGQLPPVEGSFNLMEEPDLTLKTIHRQAQDNPIIKLSILARENGFLPIRKYGPHVEKIHRYSHEAQEKVESLLMQYDEDTMVLTGYNHTRVKLNQHIRSEKFLKPLQEPSAGDRVICLRNNHEKNLYNGMLGTIIHLEGADKDRYLAEIELDDNPDLYQGFVYKPQFGAEKSINFTNKRKEIGKDTDLFDFGYALTVHKAQGSQAPKVILFEERFSKMSDEEWRRWLYTAVTRAQEELYIIGEGR